MLPYILEFAVVVMGGVGLYLLPWTEEEYKMSEEVMCAIWARYRRHK
jgi:hypothetical protein